MQASGIIETADHATPWINSFITVNKKQLDNHGKTQLCTSFDLSNLNQAIACEPLYYRTPYEIFHKLSQAKMFTLWTLARATTILNFMKPVHFCQSLTVHLVIQIHKDAILRFQCKLVTIFNNLNLCYQPGPHSKQKTTNYQQQKQNPKQ